VKEFEHLLKADKATVDQDFLQALHKAQKELGKTHEAVQQAYADVDPNFELAIRNNFEETVNIISGVKLYVDKNNLWE
jgi:ABC-type branched-subunit amino acid transport system substrate-binding protein